MSNENVSMVVGGGNGVIFNCHNVARNDKDIGPTVSKNVFDGTEVYAGDNPLALGALEPRDGMEFESKEEAFSFYKDYAKSMGFATIIKASRRSRISGKFIDAKFVCTRYGTRRDNNPTNATDIDGRTGAPVKRKRGRINQSLSKTDCKASMHVKRRQQDGRWIVCNFVKEHNHELFPDQAFYFRGHRNLDLGSRNVDAVHAIRARTKKMYVPMLRQSGQYKKNHNQRSTTTTQSGSSDHLALEEGDAQLMLDHFTYMQDENPHFFYAMDLNNEQQLRNVFWVDAKARSDYAYFGDVIFVDTAFINNECKLPVVPFIGVNHHFQGLLLGCALVASGTKSTYIWLLQAWLRAMGGHAPRVILTDQDKSLKEAIAEVFPNSHHCFCLWHILSKIPEKLSYVMRHHENFIVKFNKCILNSCTNEQFERRWWKMAERFNLRNDLWFRSLYDDRERWIPVYMRDKFLGGMSTTQRSESISSFFDKHFQRKNTLKEFLEQQKAILQEKFEEEAKADFETWHKQPGLKSPSPFGKQMAALYTHAIFKKFQIEVLGVVACHPRKQCEDGETKTFKVQDYEENRYFVVLWNETAANFSCSCRSFEFYGYLCRHVLIVMQMSGVHIIPRAYILKRWTKDAKNRESTREQLYKVESRVQCYNDLCRQAFKLGEEGSLSQESYDIAFTALEGALRKCEIVNNSIQIVIDTTSSSPNRSYVYEDANQADKTNNKESASRKKQVHSEPEVVTIGMDESWQPLGYSNLRASTCDCSYAIQESMRGMGQLNSKASSRGDYYSNLHGMQRLGQLNAIASSHDAHYPNQRRMQEMEQLHYGSQTICSCSDMQNGVQEMGHSNEGPAQLNGMASKHFHSKHLSH